MVGGPRCRLYAEGLIDEFPDRAVHGIVLLREIVIVLRIRIEIFELPPIEPYIKKESVSGKKDPEALSFSKKRSRKGGRDPVGETEIGGILRKIPGRENIGIPGAKSFRSFARIRAGGFGESPGSAFQNAFGESIFPLSGGGKLPRCGDEADSGEGERTLKEPCVGEQGEEGREVFQVLLIVEEEQLLPFGILCL